MAFFAHARADCFVGRGGDGITQPLKKAGMFKLLDSGRPRSVSLAGRIFANLLEAEALGRMPELLFVCCNPDQLGLFTGELTRFLENLSERGRLGSLEAVRRHVPILLVLPNGILSEQTLRAYDEQLHESLLMQRLPGVTEAMIQALLDRVVRGISLQAGGRRGSGIDTVYVLERKGSLVFAGGGESERERVGAILEAHDFPAEHACGLPGTRIEFDKAMISCVLNVGGLIHTVKRDGSLIDLRMGDLCKDPSKADFVGTITRAVFKVGRACGAYASEAVYEPIWAKHRETILGVSGHVTSSLKQFRDALDRGLDTVKLFSNEEWILTPLCHYAAKAGLQEEEAFFHGLRRHVQESMARAIRYRDKSSNGRSIGTRTMRLVAQRNIGVELFEAGPDTVVLVGTMLDNEHLIKLEMSIHLADEQITRSRLDMIRVPFPVCREVESVAERLVGLRIERGVLTAISERVGGSVGCSHIKELATNIVYFAASYLVRRRTGIDSVGPDFISRPAEERFTLTKELLRDSCLAYCQTTSQGLDERIGIKRVGDEHTSPLPLGEYETSLGSLLRDRAKRWGTKTYLRYRDADGVATVSFTEFEAQVSRIAGHLLKLGVRPGDRIAVLSENRPEMYLFEMAVMSIGAMSVPIFAGYPGPQVDYVLGHARPCFVVVSGKHQLDKIERDRHPGVQAFYSMDFDDSCETWGALDFASLTSDSGVSPEELTRRIETVSPADLCMIMYTSGTTGPPKGVKLRHRNLISQQKALSLIWDVGDSDVLLAYLPWHHSFGGLFERFITLYSGCELCLDDSRGRNIDRLMENWKCFNPSLFFSVPRVHDMLVARCREDPEARKAVFSGRLRFVFTAGAPLPAAIEATYRDQGIPILEGWGLTETSPCVTMTARDRTWRSGYVGFPIPGVKVRVDSDQEILVKGPNVMAGYLDDEDATSRVIDEDGWFHSGDLGEFTREGLRIIGRRDGAFKLTTGEKVHPQRIENILVNESPYISMAIAVGGGKDYVAALICPDLARLKEWARQQGIPSTGPPAGPGTELLGHPAVRNLYASELERLNSLIEVKYQRVRVGVLMPRELSLEKGELTPSGKIARPVVLENFKEEVNALFARSPEGEHEQMIDMTRTELQKA